MRAKSWIKTVPSLAIIGSILFMVLTVGGGLLLWGSNFAGNMVHNQLSDQRISFPACGGPGLDAKEFPGLQRYAGRPSTTARRPRRTPTSSSRPTSRRLPTARPTQRWVLMNWSAYALAFGPLSTAWPA